MSVFSGSIVKGPDDEFSCNGPKLQIWADAPEEGKNGEFFFEALVILMSDEFTQGRVTNLFAKIILAANPQ
jgi:hypothetical protein